MVNRLAASSPELDAGVAYYGRQVPAAQVPNIKAALLLHYAENDDGVNAGIAAYEAALKANNKKLHAAHVSGHAARLQQRHRRGALQQGGRRPRLGPHGRVLRGAPRRAAEARRDQGGSTIQREGAGVSAARILDFPAQRVAAFDAARSACTKS